MGCEIDEGYLIDELVEIGDKVCTLNKVIDKTINAIDLYSYVDESLLNWLSNLTFIIHRRAMRVVRDCNTFNDYSSDTSDTSDASDTCTLL
jgi:hypothetical protein